MRNLRTTVIGILLVFMLASVPLFTRAADTVEAAKGGQPKVVICHVSHDNDNGDPVFHTITVAEPAVKAHEKHGDKLGPCPTVTPSPSPSAVVIPIDSDALRHAADMTLAGARY